MDLQHRTITLQHLADSARQDALSLFLGAALLTIALLAAGALAIRRRKEPLLAYFAIFAFFYGLRLILQRHTTDMAFQGADWFHRIRDSLNYMVPIPALLFFQHAGFIRYLTRYALYALTAVAGTLSALTLIVGQQSAFLLVNNVAVLVLLAILLVDLARRTEDTTKEFRIARLGLALFALFALYDNIVGLFAPVTTRLEPIGFVVFLGALGYVTLSRMFQREEKLIAIESELEIARRIQFSILPKSFPAKTAFRVAARYLPMTAVAGDFYDFVVAEDARTGLLIADVSGHGVPAALIASMVKLAAASQKNRAADPAGFLAGMNAALCGNTQSQFVTAAYVFLDSHSQRITYAAAGHPPMLLVRDGNVSQIEENGLMLAAFDFATFTNRALPLQAKDRILLYTDGAVEAENQAGESFGNERLSRVVLQTSQLPVEAAADAIVQKLQTWSSAQEDDITILLCEFVDHQ